MLVQASTSRTTLSSHSNSDPVPHSDQLRRLLYRLDKSELIKLAQRWLSSSQPHHLPPRIHKRSQPQSQSNNVMLYHAIVDLNEERRARSLQELRLLWSGPMGDPKVPKARALDRILNVDWSESISYGMIAEADLIFANARRTSRNWTAVKLEYQDDVDKNGRGFERLSAKQLLDKFSIELAHYFEHHVYLQAPERSGEQRRLTPPAEDAKGWAAPFTYLRVVLAPSPSDICGTGLHILHIPRSPYLLYSGSLGRGNENREMALSAFAQAAGATTLNYPKPIPGSLQARRLVLDKAGEDKDGNKRTLGELKGKDPVALREVLVSETGCLSSSNAGCLSLAGVAGGGKAREMRSADGIEDGPLVSPLKRRREEDVYSIGVRLPTPPPTDEDKGASGQGLSGSEVSLRKQASRTATPAPREGKARQREGFDIKAETQREARDLFGLDQELTKVERIDYEKPYKQPILSDSENGAIKLRIEGTHVLAGLRKLVEAGMDRKTYYDDEARKLPGLPGWLTEVRGTKVVVVEMPPEEEE